MNLKEWYEVAKEGTSGDMVDDILSDWSESEKHCKELCEIYFNIAAELIGEQNVRLKRDAIINKKTLYTGNYNEKT